jgi:hypothetical protein
MDVSWVGGQGTLSIGRAPSVREFLDAKLVGPAGVLLLAAA